MADIAFLGLGVMGFPMAGHLAAAGHRLRVWNRSEEKVQAWTKTHDGERANSPAEAVQGCSHVFMCLGDDPDVREVYSAFEPALMAGALLVDHTTASAGLAKEIHARAGAQNVGFLDAPISGGQAGAEAGRLTVMCGGDAPAFTAATEIMSAYAQRMTHIGPAGSGQLAKSVNQICIAGLVQGLSEGLHFAQQAGLDISQVIEAIGGGAAQSWQMDNRWKTMAAGEYAHGFAVDWMRKDLRIALAYASQIDARLPVTALVDQFYGDVQAQGGGRWDTSSLLTRLAP